MKKIILFLVLTNMVFSKSAEEIFCKFCKTENKSNYSFCINCGKALPSSNLSSESNALKEHRIDHLFSIPKTDMLRSLDISFMLGGVYGVEEEQSFLGTMGLGIGDVAQLEVSTIGFVGNLLGVSNIATIGLKGKIYNGNKFLPSVALSLRSSNDWDYINENESDIMAAAVEQYADGLRGYNYEMRFTTLGIIFSHNLNDRTVLHGGLNYMDTRYRNLWRHYFTTNNIQFPVPNTSEQSEDLIGLFGGIEQNVNERTYFMAEYQTLPNFKFNLLNGKLEHDRISVVVLGVRFAVLKWLVIDTGARYQSTFNGLADVQIRLSANIIFSLLK